MGENGHICSSCGHLSPATWKKCHSCSNELDEEDSRSVDEISNYYTFLAAGFGRYVVLGYLTVVGSVLCFLALGVAVGIFNPSGVINNVLGILVILMMVSFLLGLSLFFGSKSVLQDDLNDNAPGFVNTVLRGFIMLIIISIVLGILWVIPFVNLIVALILTVVVLVSPLLVYSDHQKYQVRRLEALRALLNQIIELETGTDQSSTVNESANSSQEDSGEVSMASFHHGESVMAQAFALEVLAATPPSAVTTGYRELLTDHLRGDLDSVYALVKAESFVDAVETIHQKTSDTDRIEVLDLLLKSGKKFQNEERFDEAQTCYEAADDLITSFGLDEDTYSEAFDQYQATLDALDAEATEQRDKMKRAVKKVREDLNMVGTDHDQRSDAVEALRSAERSLQEAIAAHINHDQTLTRIRFRQARNTFEDARKLIQKKDEPLFNSQIEVSVQPTLELPSTTISEILELSESATTELAEAGIEIVADLDSGAESPWRPAIIEELFADDTIDEDIATTLTLLSWWQGDESYTFKTAEEIERRQQKADYGFTQIS